MITIHSGNPNNLPVSELILILIQELSAKNINMNIEEFHNFIMKYSWTLSVFSNAFREKSWKVSDFPLLRPNRSISCAGAKSFVMPENSEFFMGSVRVLRKQALSKSFCIIKESLLIFINYNSSQSIEEVVFLEGCYIKKEIRFDIFLLQILNCAQNDLRVCLAFRSEEKKNKWLKAIQTAGNMRKFKNFYSIGNKIGTGKFSEVFFAIAKESFSSRCVVKMIAKQKLNKNEREMMKNEVSILKVLDHPNIVKLIDVFDSHKYLMLVLEYIEGHELFKNIKILGKDECKINKIAKELLSALDYMNSIGVIHRDIKSENIIIDNETQTVKIIDFGLATFAYPGQVLKVVCGTLGYSAPEMISRKGYGPLVDMWSAGVILYTLFTLKLPFHNEDREKVVEKTIHSKVKYSNEDWAQYSENAQDFIKQLLIKDPVLRCTPSHALKHPWFNQNFY